MIDYWLDLDSTVTAKDIMQRLSEIDEEKYSSKTQLRTLQRRIKSWRTERANQLIFGQTKRSADENVICLNDN